MGNSAATMSIEEILRGLDDGTIKPDAKALAALEKERKAYQRSLSMRKQERRAVKERKALLAETGRGTRLVYNCRGMNPTILHPEIVVEERPDRPSVEIGRAKAENRFIEEKPSILGFFGGKITHRHHTFLAREADAGLNETEDLTPAAVEEIEVIARVPTLDGDTNSRRTMAADRAAQLGMTEREYIKAITAAIKGKEREFGWAYAL